MNSVILGNQSKYENLSVTMLVELEIIAVAVEQHLKRDHCFNHCGWLDCSQIQQRRIVCATSFLSKQQPMPCCLTKKKRFSTNPVS